VRGWFLIATWNPQYSFGLYVCSRSWGFQNNQSSHYWLYNSILTLNKPAPALRIHYKCFNTTTGRSATVALHAPYATASPFTVLQYGNDFTCSLKQPMVNVLAGFTPDAA
jgi:hypothetical protein